MEGHSRAPFRKVMLFLVVVVSLALITLPRDAAAHPPEHVNATWSFGSFVGVMTDDRASEALNPTRVRFVDQYLAGILLGYDQPLGKSRLSLGFELQAVLHVGDQDFYEIALPVTLRYHPENSWWDAFDSFAFGLGGSHYSQISNLERRIYGESRRNLFYWFLETEFTTNKPGQTLFARLHHRSNGYGTLEPNGGSNALVFGVRHAF